MISVNAARSACENAGPWRCMLGLLDEMRECEVKQKVIGLAAMIVSKKVKDWRCALWLLDEVRERELSPDAISRNAR